MDGTLHTDLWKSETSRETKMGVASLIFEPHPPNFENQYNFWRYLSDTKMIFLYLYWFQIFEDQCGVFRPYL